MDDVLRIPSRQNLFSDSERIITTFLYNFDKEIRVGTEWDHYTDILRALDTIPSTPAAPANVCKFCGQPYYRYKTYAYYNEYKDYIPLINIS